MICQYCSAQNDSDEHRCLRCGRRLQEASPRRPEMFPVQHGSAAPALNSESHSKARSTTVGPQLVTGLPSGPAASEYLYQPSLFGPQAVPRQEPDTQPRQPAPSQRRHKRDRSLQPSLFDATQETRTLATSVEAAVYCNAPVAIAQHRVAAASIDVGIAVLGVMVFAATFWLGGAEVALNKVTIPMYMGCVLLISLLYRLLFWAGNNDTLGLQMTGLLLLNLTADGPLVSSDFIGLPAGV